MWDEKYFKNCMAVEYGYDDATTRMENLCFSARDECLGKYGNNKNFMLVYEAVCKRTYPKYYREVKYE